MAGFFDFFRRSRSGVERAASSPLREFAFREIKKTWSAEASEITEQENGFDWLPGSHKVHVRIMPEEGGDDPSRHRLWITTDFLQAVHAPDKASVNVGTMAHTICPTFAPVCVMQRRPGTQSDVPAGIYFFSSAYVNESTVGWLSGFLARMSMLQPLQAERLSESFSSIFGADAPAYATGSKRQTDSMVFQLDDMMRTQSGGMSDWIGSPEFEEFAERYAKNDNCFGMADQGGMSLETPFGSDSASIRFDTDGAYPSLGEGLHVRTLIRSTATRDQICGNAAHLNYLEATQWTDFPQLGCWHFHAPSDDQRILAHSCFIPSMFLRDGLVTNYGLWAIARALWAADILLPSAKRLTMREILESRFGIGGQG